MKEFADYGVTGMGLLFLIICGVLIASVLMVISLFFVALRIVASPLGILTSVLGSAFWVYADAKKLQKHGGIPKLNSVPELWVLSCLLVWPVAFPIYLHKRRDYCVLACATDDLFAIRFREEQQHRVTGWALFLYLFAAMVLASAVLILVTLKDMAMHFHFPGM